MRTQPILVLYLWPGTCCTSWLMCDEHPCANVKVSASAAIDLKVMKFYPGFKVSAPTEGAPFQKEGLPMGAPSGLNARLAMSGHDRDRPQKLAGSRPAISSSRRSSNHGGKTSVEPIASAGSSLAQPFSIDQAISKSAPPGERT